MSNTVLPANPNNRKAILIMKKFDLAKISVNTEYKLQISDNPQIFVLTIPINQDNNIVSKLEQDGLLIPGSILIQNPYDTDSYVEAVDAILSLTLQKICHVSHFCQLLGARNFFIDHMEMVNSEGDVIVSGEIKSSVLTANGSASMEVKSFEKIRKQIKLLKGFRQIPPNWQEAESYLIKHHIADPFTNDLLEHFKGNRTLDTYELDLSLTKEIQKNLKILFALNIPIYAEFKTQIERIKKDLHEYNLKIKVEF